MSHRKFGYESQNGERLGIVPGTGVYDDKKGKVVNSNFWPSSGAIPESYSAGGWTISSDEGGEKDSYELGEHWDFNDGFKQQTFLGASIRSFNLTGGFGDTSSSMSVQLVSDEYNISDQLGYGLGDDVYHNGKHDLFMPPPVGTPTFFKFGKRYATVEEAWRKTFDDLYGYQTLDDPPKAKRIIAGSGEPINPFPNTEAEPFLSIPEPLAEGKVQENTYLDLLNGVPDDKGEVHWYDRSRLYKDRYNGRGRNHFNFGGILQSYTQNRGPGGNPVYAVSVSDPREILSNVDLILNNYGGTTYNNKNLINVFGFLEYDTTEALEQQIEFTHGKPNNLKKIVNPLTGGVSFIGDDLYRRPTWPYTFSNSLIADVFPKTGKGYSRRSPKGIPLYRVIDALTALLEYNGKLPHEYREAGFGGAIDFRGFKYVVDFSGIPIDKIAKITPYYFLDFDQMTMMDLAQELCDIISHDLFVSLLPVINHPASQWLHDWNTYVIENQGDPYPYLNGNDPNKVIEPGDIIAGIIRVDAIDRSKKPEYGTIKKYIDDLESRGVLVENSDVGFELSNIPTDKFVVGAQETKLHFFTSNRDRDHLEVRKFKNGLDNKVDFLSIDQWMLHRSLEQQVIPFYGFLGDDAVTIPRGFGSYQQILLDATELNANGVGNYYVATELELRAASLGYKHWKEFLLQYNDLYMESMEDNDAIEASLLMQATAPVGQEIDPEVISNNYGVSVPRCVWRSDRNYIWKDGLPASPCSPPYGYPLYYKRAEKIGIPEAGVAKIAAARTSIITNLAQVRSKDGQNQFKKWINTAWSAVEHGGGNETEKKWIEYIRKKLLKPGEDWNQGGAMKAHAAVVGLLEDVLESHCMALQNIQRVGEKTIENSMKVFNFVKGVADKHLGKTFLVKLPKRTNLGYSKYINCANYGNQGFNERVCEIATGPFGFKPEPISSQFGWFHSMLFQMNLWGIRHMEHVADQSYLSLGDPDATSYTHGGLKNNYNPMSDQYEHNYVPDNKGGFFENTQFAHMLSVSDFNSIPNETLLPLGTQQLLIPKNITNFTEGDGRISSYVAFYNSQYLNLSSVSKNDLCQERITPNGFIPDMVEELDNVGEDKFTSLNAKGRMKTAAANPAVAFVKCNVDEKLYMVPKSHAIYDKAFGREVVDIGGHHVGTKIWNKETCKFEDSLKYYEPHFVPNPENGGFDGTYILQEDFQRVYNPVLNGEIICTETRTELGTDLYGNDLFRGQDPDNVYALITLPGRISATIDSRCADGPYQFIRPTLIKHFLTMDTIKDPQGFLGFEKPSMRGRPTTILADICDQVTVDQMANAFEAYKTSMDKVGIASAEARLHFAAPSPIYPDLVALPLMSKDRCYGPWISSQLAGTDADRYSDLGGRCEYVKDENLAPWNYAGFQLMNEAGRLSAQFSNSLLLFSERGGFIVPEAPVGNSLGQQLMGVGPLVTNISIDVSDGGLKTTYKMDLYTSRFGKLQKQKEIAIGQITRERQKLTDQRNDLIRKGMGKGQSSTNYSMVYSQYNDIVNTSKWSNTLTGEVEGSD